MRAVLLVERLDACAARFSVSEQNTSKITTRATSESSFCTKRVGSAAPRPPAMGGEVLFVNRGNHHHAVLRRARASVVLSSIISSSWLPIR